MGSKMFPSAALVFVIICCSSCFFVYSDFSELILQSLYSLSCIGTEISLSQCLANHQTKISLTAWKQYVSQSLLRVLCVQAVDSSATAFTFIIVCMCYGQTEPRNFSRLSWVCAQPTSPLGLLSSQVFYIFLELFKAFIDISLPYFFSF